MTKKIDWRKKRKAYESMERDSLNDDNPEQQARADKAMDDLSNKTISPEEFYYWVYREEEARDIDYRGA